MISYATTANSHTSSVLMPWLEMSMNNVTQ